MCQHPRRLLVPTPTSERRNSTGTKEDRIGVHVFLVMLTKRFKYRLFPNPPLRPNPPRRRGPCISGGCLLRACYQQTTADPLVMVNVKQIGHTRPRSPARQCLPGQRQQECRRPASGKDLRSLRRIGRSPVAVAGSEKKTATTPQVVAISRRRFV